jgi:hypothetical protein
MSFRAFGSSTTLNDVIAERRNDAAVIDDILKRLGRDVTGKRALPTAFNDVISGDKEGDFLDSATERYELRKHSSVLKWRRWTINTGF